MKNGVWYSYPNQKSYLLLYMDYAWIVNIFSAFYVKNIFIYNYE